jgi:predicted dithiol-disulfide oxidoreductase (DUF899 family)
MHLPPIVSESQWQQAHEELLAKEKEAMRASDALAAERRRQPMVEFSTDYEFEGPDGVVDLLGLFRGRRQLIVYHFWFPPGGEPCTGCSMFTDQLGHPAHFGARDTAYANLSRAPQQEIEGYKRRMGWEDIPWYTDTEAFQIACGTTEYQALHVFVRDDADRVFLTYKTTGRGSRRATASGRCSTGRRSAGRRSGRRPPPAGRRPRPTSGGASTTSTTGRAHDVRPRRRRPGRGAALARARRGRVLARARLGPEPPAQTGTSPAAPASPKLRNAATSAGSTGARGDPVSCVTKRSTASGCAPGPSSR